MVVLRNAKSLYPDRAHHHKVSVAGNPLGVKSSF
jgi:hypothetical protein